MTRRRKLVFALLAMTLACVFVLGALLAGDIYVHRKFAEMGGVNIWGYRGPAVGRKRTGERRVAVLGESTAFGFGLPPGDALPAALERLLNESPGQASKVSVVNLAYNGEGAHSYRYTLEDYAYLKSDVAVFYTGYPDLPFLRNFATPNQEVYRRKSPMFRLTGYFPMLPLVMREKAMAIRYGGRLEDAYLGRPTVFRPSVAQRSKASALEAAVKVSETIERYMAKMSSADVGTALLELPDAAARQCGVYTGYCAELFLDVKYALDHGTRVVVVTQPYMPATHREQQLVMAEYLRKRFPDRAALRFVDLGAAIDLVDPALTLDGMHLTAAGNRVIARGMLEAVKGALDGAVAPPDPVRPAIRVVTAGLPADEPPASAADTSTMVRIQPGTFRMGTGETSHQVTIDPGFWMDRTEVTKAAYRRFLQERPAWTPSRVPTGTYDGVYLTDWKGAEPASSETDHPVTGVPWHAANAYCRWAGKRLPTEAEWEYAARGGTATAYWWGDAFDGTRANMNGRGPEPVGHGPRVNPWGLADTAGNVWEWTASWHLPYPYRSDDGRERAEPAGDGRRVLRGGAWIAEADQLRSDDRYPYNPRIAAGYVGFRCAASVSPVQ
jgi:formylglycine-generating enzyme required for sulfatase activity